MFLNYARFPVDKKCFTDKAWPEMEILFPAKFWFAIYDNMLK